MPHDVLPVGATGIEPSGRDDPRSLIWRTRLGPMTLDRPRILGVLNLTPDSFWGDSRTAGPHQALRRAAAMIGDGADVIDIGGESTRPGAAPVAAGEEARRVAPVVRALAREWPDVPLSVDTVKSAVAAAALDEGAAVINDVSAFRLDPAMAALAASTGAGVILMHSRGPVESMASYDVADYTEDPVGEIADELRAAAEHAAAAGVEKDRVVVDPGLGFAKRTEHSVAALRELGRIRALGYPVLVGPSRKRFVGELAGGLPVEDRLPGTIAACTAALFAGARLFRVHDVTAVRRALEVAEALAP